MPSNSKQSRAEKARRHLSGAFPFPEDSEDELSLENRTWEWIYDDAFQRNPLNLLDTERKIVGARRGKFECRVGDTLLLKAGRNESWIALLCDFIDDGVQSFGDESEKYARFLWFSTPHEIRNNAKKRTDALPNELYITADSDENSLDTITGNAKIFSYQSFMSKYPNERPARRSNNHSTSFVCRRGCNTRTATYTEEFIWEDVYRGPEDIESIKELVANGTTATRNRKLSAKASVVDDFIVYEDEELEDNLRTPRKRRKLQVAGTPKSKSQQTSPRKLTTPQYKRIITKRPLEFTPLGTRVISPKHNFSSPFQIARSQLHVSSVPTSLPCREEEFSTVYTYLESAITEGTGSCIYISGTPGTGKTATVREVIRQLNNSVQAEELDDFIYVEINGMKVTDPHQSYSLLWEALTGDRLSSMHALGLLEREFSSPSPRRVPCVVLMDELDQLVTKNQSVMYNFFNWPGLRHSRLIVIAVANTMDLPERTLSNKISSRLGLTRINFPVYTHEQLIKIIQSRLENVPGNLVDHDAVQFASRKVAQVSGDARRALDICRRAVEIAEAAARSMDPTPLTPSKKTNLEGRTTSKVISNAIGQVKIATVQQAIREATTSPLQQHLRALPLSCKVFLASLIARIRRTGIGESLLGDIVDEARRIGGLSQLPPIHDFLLCEEPQPLRDPNRQQAKAMKAKSPRIVAMGGAAVDLMEAGLILLESRNGDRIGRVRLIIGEEEVRLALKDDTDVSGLGFSV